MRLRTCSSASRSLLEAERQLEPLDDVERLEQLDLLLEGEVRGVAGGVGQRARLGDRAHEGAHPAVVAAELEDLLHDGAVLALELAGARRRRGLVGPRLDLDPEVPVGPGRGGPGEPAVKPRQQDRAAPPGSRTRSTTSATTPTLA